MGYSFSSMAQNDSIMPVNNWWKKHHMFDGLEVGINIGSTGVGLSVNTPVTKWADIRAGVDWVPNLSFPLHFNLNTYSDGMPTGNFNKVANMLYDYTGIMMDETVKMTGNGSMVNFKFLVDFFPIPNSRHWHITAGFYVGTSHVGKAINNYEEKPTLVALNIYNRAYEYFTNLESFHDLPLGSAGSLNPEKVKKIKEKFAEYGRMGIHIGDFKDGSSYIMEPAPDGSLSAKAFVNHFKPYVGTGYTTHLDHNKKWQFGVDFGVLFWGGAPDIIHYDYANNREINFSKDLINIRGKVGDYVKIIKSFPVYPVLEIRFSYSIL